MTGIALALASALSWGTADYLGGTQSKRLASYTVAFWSQAAGALGMLVLVVALRPDTGWAATGWGITAGVCTGSGLIVFYRGLASGAMAVVAPLSACAAVLPVAVSVISGDSLSAVQFGGIALCLAGAVAVSTAPAGQARGHVSRSVIYGVAAAVGFGLFYVFIDRANDAGGSVLAVIAGARGGALLAVLTLTGLARQPLRVGRSFLPLLAVTGVIDTGANLLFALSATRGELGVVSVLGSLYPVVTVALAVGTGGERVTWLRVAGGITALAGVAVLSAG